MENSTEQMLPKEKTETGFDTFNNLIGCAMKHIERLKFKGMHEYGLSGTHTLCLRRLYESEKGMTRTELAHACQVDRAQITRVIGELLAKELVVEKGEGSIYRKKCILTPAGREITSEINALVAKIQFFVSGNIPQEELASFYKTLHVICEKLREAETLL
jgi:DNA-binding MarR family transcriptional regulator